MIDFNEEKQEKRILDIHKAEEERMVKHLAKQHGVEYIDLGTTPIDIEALRTVDEKTARETLVAPFNLLNKKLSIAVISPKNDGVIAILEKIKTDGYIPRVFMASRRSLGKVWDRYQDLSQSKRSEGGSFDISSDAVADFLKEKHDLKDIKERLKELGSSNDAAATSKILEIVLSGALALGASDLHLEPEKDDVLLRYRLDGVLAEIGRIKNHNYRLFLARILILSELRLNEHGKAQDGRFSISLNNKEIQMRISIIPGAYNDSIVMRVLDPDSIAVSFDQMGIHPRLLKILDREITRPNGMILNTGPTGSGKTTTLYAFLRRIYTPGIKIITIENPVEYHLKGIVQTQTNHKEGYDFLAGLRSAMRQDPDVIMVGEIRDNETATVAIDAALTGHLVVSTLHTNSAAGTFSRLIDLGISPKTLMSAITVAMAQRLVRKLIPGKGKEVLIEGKDREVVDRILNSITDKSYLEGIQTEKMWVRPESVENDTDIYKGRLGVFEVILSDPKLEEILTSEPSERQIVAATKDQGILNMKQDGILKVLQGITSLEELRRVIDIDSVEIDTGSTEEETVV